MVLDVVRRDSNLLLKTRLISLRLYRVWIRSYQKGFSFDRFVRRGVVFLVLVLVCQMGFPLVWVWVSCCDVVCLLHWVLPQRVVIRILLGWFRGKFLGAEPFLAGVRWFWCAECSLSGLRRRSS